MGIELSTLYFNTVNFSPSGRMIFSSVSKLGVVLKDSILATEDCGLFFDFFNVFCVFYGKYVKGQKYYWCDKNKIFNYFQDVL